MHDHFERHDHARCRKTAMAAVEAVCAEKKLRLTDVRRRVLEILLDDHRALGAYEVLARLAEDGFGSQPPVVYRALDFLVTNGFAHRIEQRNAFIACVSPGEEHDPAFLICQSCDTIAETPSETPALGDAAATADFTIVRSVVEAEGICPACKDRS